MCEAGEGMITPDKSNLRLICHPLFGKRGVFPYVETKITSRVCVLNEFEAIIRSQWAGNFRLNLLSDDPSIFSNVLFDL